MFRRLAILLLVAVSLALAAARWGAHGHATAALAGGSMGVPAAGPSAAASAHPEIGFASRARLAQHFEKHGREFGAASAQEYLRLAQALRDRPVGGPVLEAVRGDGTVCRFDRASGAFLAFREDRVIHTFFKPYDGERYFHHQMETEH